MTVGLVGADFGGVSCLEYQALGAGSVVGLAAGWSGTSSDCASHGNAVRAAANIDGRQCCGTSLNWSNMRASTRRVKQSAARRHADPVRVISPLPPLTLPQRPRGYRCRGARARMYSALLSWPALYQLHKETSVMDVLNLCEKHTMPLCAGSRAAKRPMRRSARSGR